MIQRTIADLLHVPQEIGFARKLRAQRTEGGFFLVGVQHHHGEHFIHPFVVQRVEGQRGELLGAFHLSRNEQIEFGKHQPAFEVMPVQDEVAVDSTVTQIVSIIKIQRARFVAAPPKIVIQIIVVVHRLHDGIVDRPFKEVLFPLAGGKADPSADFGIATVQRLILRQHPHGELHFRLFLVGQHGVTAVRHVIPIAQGVDTRLGLLRLHPHIVQQIPTRTDKHDKRH